MEVVPSTFHGRLKFEFQGEVHTILYDPQPYSLCNATNFEDMALIPPLFEIKPLDESTPRAHTNKQVQITKIGMGTYHINEIDLFMFVKDLRCP